MTTLDLFNALTTEHDAPLELTPLAQGEDYARVRLMLEYLTHRWRDQPSIENLSAAAGLSAADTHLLFRRWAGMTPQAFVHAITLDEAKKRLAQSVSVLDTAFDVGLSGSSRLHDLFVTHEAMSPGEYKTGAARLVMRYGFHPSPFGEALVMITQRGLAGMGFADDGKRDEALEDMQKRWPRAHYVADQVSTAPFLARVFNPEQWRAQNPLRIVLIGTDFHIRVWETLLKIPLGSASTYGAIAQALGKPTAARAVGAAVGRNPLSFVVPCHRVLGKGGSLTGYHWGLTRKQAMLGWEYGRAQ
jgi:AraC family transcriptional regulator, regulatory protein of adaptative response / methylated-DNA-[protein]-cysteine methyltransferase